MLQLQEVAVANRLLPFTTQVAAGSLIHLVGPNGAGKSSLLSRLAGMLPGSGEVVFLGQPLPAWSGNALARHRAWLPQQQPPAGLMAVWHYLQLHLVNGQGDHDNAVAGLLAALQLTDKLERQLQQLSGGEWQRVRLAAVLLQCHPQLNHDARLLLLDEPMTGLDIAQQAAVNKLIRQHRDAGITVIMSSHDLNHSLQQAESVWLMHRGEVQLTGDPQQVLQPTILQPIYQVTFRRVVLDDTLFLLSPR